MKRNDSLTVLILIVLSTLVVACSTTPAARFYTLSALAEQNQETVGNKAKTRLGISPVEVSPYLERSEIVTRKSTTQVELATYERWAEPLEDLVATTLSENITRLQPSIDTIVRPWAEAGVDYMLEIKITRFDSDAQGNINLVANWGIVEQKNRVMQVVHKSNIFLPGDAADFDSITENMSNALLKLSMEITKELIDMHTR